MPRGIVTWPDATTEQTVREIWDELARLELAALGHPPHAHQRPHCSLLVADTLDPWTVVDEVRRELPIPITLGAVGYFPGGVLQLSVTPSLQLLQAHRSAHAALTGIGWWDIYLPEQWNPHVTLAMDVPLRHLGPAVDTICAHLPITGSLVAAGVEDGETGERWPW